MVDYTPERSDAFERLIRGEIDLKTYSEETRDKDVAEKLLERLRELGAAQRETGEAREIGW
jgi:hypothetical protein